MEVPLVYYYGGTSPSDNPDLYRAQLASLATVLDRREAVSRQAAAAGRIINTLGWIDGLGYDLVKAAISAMRADVVLVLEQDRLYNQLSNELRGSKAVQVGGQGGSAEGWVEGKAHHGVGAAVACTMLAASAAGDACAGWGEGRGLVVAAGACTPVHAMAGLRCFRSRHVWDWSWENAYTAIKQHGVDTTCARPCSTPDVMCLTWPCLAPPPCRSSSWPSLVVWW